MPTLILRRGEQKQALSFEGQPLLSEVLLAHGISVAHPCGGRGICGKCAVALSGDVSSETEAERRAGTRLSCCARLLGDCTATFAADRELSQVEVGGDVRVESLRPLGAPYAIAVDIGTTTLALRLYDAQTGRPLGHATASNPQSAIAADVMGRIGAALEPDGLSRLNALLSETLDALINKLCAQNSIRRAAIGGAVVTGNTTMLYLLTAQSPLALAHAPFQADRLFGEMADALGMRIYLPRCMSAFVGADITCAVLASGMCEHSATALLVDVGTNGEIALWQNGQLSVSSTAAGPVFEGSGIHMGCGSISGAIDKVSLSPTGLICHTIGDAPPVGICGSGLIDAVAMLLRQGRIDETGAVEEERLALAGDVFLLPADIRNVQLAKAAIAAGIRTLLTEVHVSAQDIERFYIAGGFGSHLNVQSAHEIGLFPPELSGKEVVIGNAALAGAGMLLLDRELIPRADALAQSAAHISLGGNSRFAQLYMDEMCFPCEE